MANRQDKMLKELGFSTEIILGIIKQGRFDMGKPHGSFSVILPTSNGEVLIITQKSVGSRVLHFKLDTIENLKEVK